MFDTVYPADSVEFCPHPSALDVFVCGTYKLDEEVSAEASNCDAVARSRTQRRRGTCLVFKTTSIDGEGPGIQKVHEISLPAVLDMKWCHASGAIDPVLCIAESEGNVNLYHLELQSTELKEIDSISCASADVLCLSVDWSSRRMASTSLGSLVTSLSNGSLALLQPADQHGLILTDSWHAHDHEPWIVAWDYWSTNVIYSGGDDLKLKGWDIRQSFESPIFTNRRFDGGVTSIQSHPHLDNVLAVGSYDGTVRLFDTRKILSPLREHSVDGGAWRVKWHPSPSRKGDLLVACMHDGFKVVRFESDGAPGVSVPRTMKRYDAHKSLAYGTDWSYASGGEDETIIASCSFYDHALHLWSG